MTKPAVHLPESIRNRIIGHCLEELPHEGCGLLGVRDGEIVEVYPARNLDSSSDSFTLDPSDHFAALVDAETRGLTLGGVYHSHPNGDARMSPTDVAAALEPDWVYVVVGLRGREPTLAVHHI